MENITQSMGFVMDYGTKQVFTPLAEREEREQVKREWAGKEYDAYGATQKQRQMETQMRAQRSNVDLLRKGGADEEDIVIAQGAYMNTLHNYRDFSKTMGLAPQMERVYMDGLGRVAGFGSEKSLQNKGNGSIMGLSNKEVRKWYVDSVKNIQEGINPNMPIEVRAQIAFEERNSLRTKAREMMADISKRAELDQDKPNRTFEELVSDKITRKGLTREEALEDVYKTAIKTNKRVNTELGM